LTIGIARRIVDATGATARPHPDRSIPMRPSRSGLLALIGVAALAAPAAADGAAGPVLAGLTPPDGRLGVIAHGVIPSVDGGPATVVAILGNGTSDPVHPRVAWAAMDAVGELAWVGLPSGFTVSGDVYQMYAGPETLQPGGIGIAIEEAYDLPADASYRFAVRAGEPDPDASVLDLSEVDIRGGHLVGTVTNAAAEPLELGFSGLQVVAVCFDPAGAPTSVHGTQLDDGTTTTLAPAATMPFDIDLGGATCDRFLVVA
jgi:hypothetical protein